MHFQAIFLIGTEACCGRHAQKADAQTSEVTETNKLLSHTYILGSLFIRNEARQVMGLIL